MTFVFEKLVTLKYNFGKTYLFPSVHLRVFKYTKIKNINFSGGIHLFVTPVDNVVTYKSRHIRIELEFLENADIS